MMLAAKESSKEKSRPASKAATKSAVDGATPQIQLNPLWHSMATHVGGKAAAGASGDSPPIQTKPSRSVQL
ncbi:MAG: hypothetical protein GXP10_10335, partial [Gammaproteobacteria bacterium]|nr:hypothetical protein [Gammaproteobacteria bacterium]